MRSAEEWDNYFATTESTYRQKGETLWAWHARRYKMIQDDAHNAAVRECLDKVCSVNSDDFMNGKLVKELHTLIKPT